VTWDEVFRKRRGQLAAVAEAVRAQLPAIQVLGPRRIRRDRGFEAYVSFVWSTDREWDDLVIWVRCTPGVGDQADDRLSLVIEVSGVDDLPGLAPERIPYRRDDPRYWSAVDTFMDRVTKELERLTPQIVGTLRANREM